MPAAPRRADAMPRIDETTRDREKADRTAMVAELEAAGSQIRGSQAKCPFCADQKPSGSIFEKSGTWFFKCHSGHGCGFSGDIYTIRARRLGKDIGEVMPMVDACESGHSEAKRERTWPTLRALVECVRDAEAGYYYRSPGAQEILMAVIRAVVPGEGKRFVPCHKTADGWVMRAPAKPWPLYRLPEIGKAERVIVCEGEKAADALNHLGVVATTSPAGAGKAQYADWSPLAGKAVVLWPDFDAPGAEHMDQVAKILAGLTPRCRISRIAPAALSLDSKGDAWDFIARLDGATEDEQREHIEGVILSAESCGITSGLETLLRDTITGKRVALDWPWPILSRQTKSLMPGAVTVICGPPGATKSLMIMQALLHWHQIGYRVALFALEKNHAYHMNRALAQRCSCSGLTDDEWVRANEGATRHFFEREREFMESFGRVIHDCPAGALTQDAAADWVEKQCADGVQIVGIDPVSAIDFVGKRSDLAEKSFVVRMQGILARYGSRLIMAHHPRKGVGNKSQQPELDGLAGGAAFSRFVDCAMWLRSHHPPGESYMASDSFSGAKQEYNREISLLKVRDGKGSGLRLGFAFDGATLRSRELGIICKDVEQVARCRSFLRGPDPEPAMANVSTDEMPFWRQARPAAGEGGGERSNQT